MDDFDFGEGVVVGSFLGAGHTPPVTDDRWTFLPSRKAPRLETKRRVYINVILSEGTYYLHVESRKDRRALETIDVRNSNELTVAMDLALDTYQKLGPATLVNGLR